MAQTPEPDTAPLRDDSAPRRAVLNLLSARASSASVCPSEVARKLAAELDRPDDWRTQMPRVHAAIDALLTENAVQLSWKGARMPARTGPYRIHGARD